MVEQLSDIDKAYIAGLLDGEGSLMIMRQLPTSRKSGNVSTQYLMRVSMTNTDEGIIRWLHSTCGGLLTKPSKSRGPNDKPVWHWRITSKAALDLVHDLRPFLRIKATQAWLMLEAAAQFTQRAGGYGKVPVEELALREGYALAMQHLNARGI